MKSKKKILLVILTLMVLGIISISAYYFNTRDNKKINNGVNSTDKVEDTNTNSDVLETDEVEKENEIDYDTKNSESDRDTELSNQKNKENKNESSNVEESKQNNVSSTTKTEQKNDNTESNQTQDNNNYNEENVQETQKEETNSSSNSNSNNNSNNTSNNNSSNSGVWDELGITEYDYYNSPMWSWAKVTHKTKTECIAAGDAAKAKELEKDESERKGVLFTCTEIYSYSGNYLGEMLEVEYLD